MATQVMRFKRTDGMSEREIELEAMVEELVWAMHLWGQDEDNSVHPDAWNSFEAALKMARIPYAQLEDNENGDPQYRFDAEWARRQKVTWAMRNEQEGKA